MPLAPSNADEVRDIVEAAIRVIPDTDFAARLTPMLRPAIRHTLPWEYGNNEPFDAWRFADLGERDVWATYCVYGHGALGYPWGLVFIDSDYFGMNSGWYPTLFDLFEEWFA